MRTTICLPASLSHPCLGHFPVTGDESVLSCSPSSAQCRHGVSLPPSLLARKPLTLEECCCSFPNTGPKVPGWELPLNYNWQLATVGTVESWESVLFECFEFLSVWEDWAEREQEVCCIPVKPAAPSWNWDGWVLVLLRV